MTLYGFKKQAGEDTEILGIVSQTGSVKKVQNNMRIKEGQILVIKTPPDDIGYIVDIFNFSIPKRFFCASSISMHSSFFTDETKSI